LLIKRDQPENKCDAKNHRWKGYIGITCDKIKTRIIDKGHHIDKRQLNKSEMKHKNY
jgi:hypothetical protein